MKILEVKNAAFSYTKKENIFEDITFSIEEGEVFSIVGPNGCGKTTLLDSVLGLNEISLGVINLNGKNIKDIKAKEFAQNIAYVPQGHKTTFAYKVLDIVVMGRTYATRMFEPPNKKEEEIAMKALKEVSMESFWDREYTSLSGGELQLVLIARAIAQKASILVMDEPTAHLDFRHELKVMEIIGRLVKEKKISILMATHFLNQPFYLENMGVKTTVALMNNKRFVSLGKPSEVLNRESLEDTFNIVTEIINEGERKYILPLYSSEK